MSNFNPYEPPKSHDSTPISDGAGYRRGKKVYLPLGNDLPPRCIRCNAPVEGTIKTRSFYWHHPGIYALLLLIIPFGLFGLLAYWIVTIIVRKKVALSPALCPHHTHVRTAIMISAITLIILNITAAYFFSGYAVWVILTTLLILIPALYLLQLCKIEHISDTEIRIGGLSAPFRESFPPSLFPK